MKNLFYILFIGVFLLSCGTENEPTYKLTTTVSPTEGGTISPSTGVYSKDEVVELTGTPSTGWRFVRWEGDWEGEINPVNLGMTRDFNVVGVFEKRNYPLNITIEGNGTVEERVVQQKSTDYPYGTVVELTPIPSEGWEFVEWGGDLSGDEVPKQITVDGEKTVTVKFERKNYPLTINIVGEGTVTETIIPQKSTDYPYGTVVQLTPVPKEGWFFWNYREDLSWNTVPQNIVVDEDKNVTITFIRKGTINSLYLYSYDSNNNRIEQIQYNSDGSISFRYTYSHDSNNNLIQQIRYNSDGSIISTWTYSYDSNNNRIEQIRYYPDGSILLRYTYFYDSNNNLIEWIQYNSDGSISIRRINSYDSNNNWIEGIQYNSGGSISIRYTNSYDSNNNLIEQIRYNSDGSIRLTWTFSYDSNNNRIEQIRYYPADPILLRYTFSYDSNNNRIEQIQDYGSIISTWTYSYDSNNNLIEQFYAYTDSNKSNSTIQTDPFNDLENYIREPFDELPLYPHQIR